LKITRNSSAIPAYFQLRLARILKELSQKHIRQESLDASLHWPNMENRLGLQELRVPCGRFGAGRPAWRNQRSCKIRSRKSTVVHLRGMVDTGVHPDLCSQKLQDRRKLSRERVRQLEARAKAKLRAHIAATYGKDAIATLLG